MEEVCMNLNVIANEIRQHQKSAVEMDKITTLYPSITIEVHIKFKQSTRKKSWMMVINLLAGKWG